MAGDRAFFWVCHACLKISVQTPAAIFASAIAIKKLINA
jgi:hypothetical protein